MRRQRPLNNNSSVTIAELVVDAFGILARPRGIRVGGKRPFTSKPQQTIILEKTALVGAGRMGWQPRAALVENLHALAPRFRSFLFDILVRPRDRNRLDLACLIRFSPVGTSLSAPMVLRL
jgi:hypothetical protein